MCGHMAELESQGSWTSGLVKVPQIIVWNACHPFLSHFFSVRSKFFFFFIMFDDYASEAWCTVVGIAHGSNTARLIFL